jgi:hypothetical protein
MRETEMPGEDLNKRGDKLVAELHEFSKKAGGHGGALRKAPVWVHQLIDWVWDYFA